MRDPWACSSSLPWRSPACGAAVAERVTADPHADSRARIQQGGLRGAELVQWLAALPPAERDRALERLLDIDRPPLDTSCPGDDLIGYIPSGVAAIARAVFEVPVQPEDLFVDVGAGAGKVAMTAHLLTGARCLGLEIQPELVARASDAALRLGLRDVSFRQADARTDDLGDGTVMYLYLPFTGPAMATVLDRIRAVALRHPIVVCALGFELRRVDVDWLAARPTDSFWLTIYDSVPGPPRQHRPLLPSLAALAQER